MFLDDNHVTNVFNNNDRFMLQNVYQIVLNRDDDHVIITFIYNDRFILQNFYFNEMILYKQWSCPVIFENNNSSIRTFPHSYVSQKHKICIGKPSLFIAKTLLSVPSYACTGLIDVKQAIITASLHISSPLRLPSYISFTHDMHSTVVSIIQFLLT